VIHDRGMVVHTLTCHGRVSSTMTCIMITAAGFNHSDRLSQVALTVSTSCCLSALLACIGPKLSPAPSSTRAPCVQTIVVPSHALTCTYMHALAASS
jgi:hypothetical protein